MNNVLVYDIESYPDVWTFTGIDVVTGDVIVFECSERVNQINEFREWMRHWSFHNYVMVGFNNIGYDYPVIHAITTDMRVLDYTDIYHISTRIIHTPWEQRFSNRIPVWKHVVKQMDLFMIHHFDNQAKSTSLKMLEFVMQANNIEDLPFKPEVPIGVENIPTLIEYNIHDVRMTLQFYQESLKAIEFRATLSEKYGKDFTNHNDTKIGKDYFIMELEKAGVHTRDSDGNLRQTYREFIDLKDCIAPYIQFEHPEFNRILNQIRNTRIYETKGALSMSAVIDGFSYDFGLGGIHGARTGMFVSDDECIIESRDVSSYYPNLAIKNKLYPEHLSEKFCEVYEDVYNQRKSYPKGTPENAAMKLALNGVYGDSNSVYSAFYDPKFTMSITISGQLSLCMLVEQLIKIPTLKMLMINTDGLEYIVNRKYQKHIDEICEWWEQLTQLELETDYYQKLAIRDCNNYVGVFYD